MDYNLDSCAKQSVPSSRRLQNDGSGFEINSTPLERLDGRKRPSFCNDQKALPDAIVPLSKERDQESVTSLSALNVQEPLQNDLHKLYFQGAPTPEVSL